MVVFGMFLLLVGVVVGLIAFFGLGYDSDGDRDREVSILSNNTTPELVFVLGMAVAIVILLGLWFTKFGASRGWSKRRERKKLDEMHDKMVEADRAEGGNDN